MKKVVSILLALSIVFTMTVGLAGITVSADTAVSFYVSSDGNDSNPGTLEQPFATINGAKNAINALKGASGGSLPVGGITVYLRGGVYPITDTINFSAADSGTNASPIVFKAYQDEVPVFDGGYTISASDFKSITDQEQLNRLDKTVQSKVKVYDLKANGITDYGERVPSGYSAKVPEGHVGPIELFVDDTDMILSRWPNDNHDMLILGQNVIEKGGSYADKTEGGGKFSYTYDEPNSWEDTSDIWLYGAFSWGFADDNIKAAEINKSEKTITLASPTVAGLDGSGSDHVKYYFYNIFEEIDMPGEYFVDTANGLLYLYPPESFSNSSKVQISNFAGNYVIDMEDASYITFSGITFENTRSGGIRIEGDATNVTLDSCTIRNMSGHAVYMGADVENSGLVGSSLYNMGRGGVTMPGYRGGNGNDKLFALEPSRYFVVGCDIYHTDRIDKCYRQGVMIDGVGSVVSFNKFHDLIQSGMHYLGAENVIEYNEFYNCMLFNYDNGVIYTGAAPWSDQFEWNNMIRYNYFHDNGNQDYGSTYDIYFDGTKGATVLGNVIARSSNSGATLSNANSRYNIYTNNIFVDKEKGAAIAINKPGSFSFEDVLTKRLLEEKGNQEWYDTWAQRYPIYANIADESVYNNAANNEAHNNIIVNYPMLFTTGTGAELLDEDNMEYSSDPGFVSYKDNNFKLKDDSKVFEDLPEFENIPFELVGDFETYYTNRMADTVALYVGNSSALVNNEPAQVDPDNAAVKPQIVDSRTLVPVRFIAESFGAEVGWDPDTATVTVNLDGKTIQMVIGSNKISVDGVESELDVPAQSIEGRTMIPLRAMVEAVGKQVFWDERGLIVISDDADLFDLETYTSSDHYLVTETIKRIVVGE